MTCLTRFVKAIRGWQTGYRKVVGDTCEGGWQPQQAVAATSRSFFLQILLDSSDLPGMSSESQSTCDDWRVTHAAELSTFSACAGGRALSPQTDEQRQGRISEISQRRYMWSLRERSNMICRMYLIEHGTTDHQRCYQGNVLHVAGGTRTDALEPDVDEFGVKVPGLFSEP